MTAQNHRCALTSLLLCATAGAAVGLAVACALLWLDIGRLWALISTSAHGIVAAAMLLSSFAGTFAVLAVATAMPDLARAPEAAGARRGTARRTV